MTFPGPGAMIYYNEAREPIGWDTPDFEPPDPDGFDHYALDHGDDDDSDRCEANARKGTGTGTCDRPLDVNGYCDRPSDHTT